ncbi:MAG: hypothetical protein GOMPHAMPRED_001467 [Gomphillus americanus]|uniref:Translocation protein n=1 Tax=Gomphillus americanus TaxID=1940652 RepID=A0A8H3F6Y5_9LECA|nr:MAG: hypothetical protein GOMPHAMPRED_001467 [Gomphillus americanus]
MVNWVSLSIPIAYLGVLVGSLVTFSYLYRRRKAAKASSLASWFPPHLQRNIYLSLLHHEQVNPETGKPVQVPDSIIKTALLRRAAEDINRIISLRNAKPALGNLLQKGSVGDDLWQRFQRAEKELEAELEDVIREANALAPGWGQHIFQSANEINANTRLRARIEEIQSKAEPEREWWAKRREELRAEFMKELDEEGSGKGEKSKPTTNHGSSNAAKSASVAGSVNSEEDGVLVEDAGTNTPSTPSLIPPQTGGKNKKKNKK